MTRIAISLIAMTMALSLPARQTEQSDSLSRTLQEITVTPNHPATRLVSNTLVSTIAGSRLQNIGTALDVLAQLPLITTTDNKVMITGKGSPEIYIDGRPMHDENELLNLQSSNIKRVELILAPGSMYASTTKAVLKISTRRNFIAGLSATDRAEATARRKFSINDMLDLNYRTGKWDVFATGTVARNNSCIKGQTINTLTYNGQQTTVGSMQRNIYPATTGSIKAGFNYASGNESFGAYYRFNPERAYFTNRGSEWLDNNAHIQRQINNTIHAHSHLASMYYHNTFAEKYLMHFDGDFSRSKAINEVGTLYDDGSHDNVRSWSNRHSTFGAVKLYLKFPFAKGDLLVGTQDSYTRTILNYRMLNEQVSEYIPSTQTDGRQISASAFAEWSRTVGNFSLSAGLRYEYVDYRFKINGKHDASVSRTDNFITPDISLSHSFNEDSQVTLSYKMSTIKHPYSMLTGSLNYVGLHEIEGGNTTLRDEHMHDIQLFGMHGDFMIQADLTHSTDSYAFVKRLYKANTLQLLMQPINIDVSAADVYLIWERNIRSWTPNITLGMHKQWLTIDGTAYRKPIFSYYFENTVTLPAGILLTVNANGQTQGDMHTNRFGTTWFTMNASVSKFFLKKALHIKLSATDIFNTLHNDWSMNTFGVHVDKQQSYDRRGIALAVTYRFQPQKSKYKGQAASAAEMGRLP